jgi:RNA polymerase sigma-70 factor (ECF subfamily)
MKATDETRGRVNSTDDALMLQVRDGDVGQLGVLFERHHVPLYNFFVRLTGNAAQSEDFVQEVFLRMMRYRHTYRGQGQFAVWMYQIARNVRTDHYRKWRRETPMPESGIDLPDHTPGASDRLEKDQAAALVHAALANLPDDKRELLLLARFQEMRYDDIAQLLDCSVGTVKVRVHRAMKELRTSYLRAAKGQVS